MQFQMIMGFFGLRHFSATLFHHLCLSVFICGQLTPFVRLFENIASNRVLVSVFSSRLFATDEHR